MIVGLRSRLILIVLAAALPALGLGILSAGSQRTAERERIRTDAIGLARELAREQQAIIERAGVVLRGLAAMRNVREATETCATTLRNALDIYPSYLNFGVIDATGILRCSGLPNEGPLDLGDRDYFRHALSGDRPALGAYQVGRITGRPSINMAIPLESGDTAVGVLFAAIDLAELDSSATALVPAESGVLVFDAQGSVLVARPAMDSVPALAELRPLLAADSGLIEIPSATGGIDVLAFARIPEDVRGEAMFAAIRTDRATLYGAANQSLRRMLVALVATTLIALLVTGWLAGRLVLRPVDRMLAATQRLAAGDLGARTGPPWADGELGRLARSFDDAAATLAAQERAREQVLGALRASEASYQSLVNNAPYGILSADLEGRLTRVNPAVVHMLGGGQPGDVLGMDLRRFLADPDERDPLAERLLGEGRIRDVEVAAVDLHGRPLRLRASGRLVTDASGVAVGTEWFVEDVSERRDLEQRLLHIQKMDAVGRLAGGVAHDFNNLLTVIIGYAAALRERLQAAADVAEIDEIRRAADRAQALTAQLLQFSRRQLMAPRVVDVNTIVSDSRRMLERVIGEQITVAVELVGEPALIRADPAQVEQVVVNLALNARDAMPRGGRLHITTGLRTIREPGRSPAHAPPGEYVVLQVSDTGTGMDAATVERIFEPFFTTKDLGRGTGLGLSTVYGIVQQSGGAIAVQSEPGAGSTFIVLFPRVDGAVDDARSASAAVALTGRGETILLVEDDNAVRALVRRFLGDRGYRVLTAAGGREAIELAAGFSGPIDLLLTDVVLPDLSPPEIRAELERTRPRMPTILMSGYATEVLSRHGGVPDGAAFIAKPFDPADLLALIRHTLQARN